MIKKYLVSYGSYILKRLVAGRSYTDWEKQYQLVTNAEIVDTKIANELEKLYRTVQRPLAYPEYQHIDQFGNYGYHNHHTYHGFQPVDKQQVADIVTFCMKNNIHHVVDFGCGSGELGVALVEAAKKHTYPLFWSGIEIHTHLHKKIISLFKKKKLEKYLEAVTDTITNSSKHHKTALLFSFSLDSIPPQLCINTHDAIHAPTTIIGLTLQNNTLSEKIFDTKELPENISFEKSILIYNNIQWDLREWQLHPMQRAYIPLDALNEIIHASKVYNAEAIIILDEFRKPRSQESLEHIGLPYDLHSYGRECTDIEQIYKETGKNLYYYPLYIQTLQPFLESIGFGNITIQMDPLFQKMMAGNSVKTNRKINTCETIFATGKLKKISKINLSPPF